MDTTTVRQGRSEKQPTAPINNLRAVRNLCGVSPQELADYLEVSAPVISQAELLRSSALGKASWYRLAHHFDLDPRVLEGVLPIPPDYSPPSWLKK